MNTFKLFKYYCFFLFIGTVSVHAQDVYPGWAFFSSGNDCYLYDMDKELIHTWTSDYNAGASCLLMRDSSVMFNARDPSPWNSGGALTNGRLQIIKWDGTVAWNFKYTSSEYCPHHNIELVYKTDDPKETPNVLVACYTNESGDDRKVDKVVEIKPTGATTGEVVWEWHAWEHRTSSPNDNVGMLDEDGGGTGGMMDDWTHLNSISYNRDLDQLVFGLKHFYEFVIIDHSTTTAEASSSSGGKYGKGGDFLYRWGQASNYGCSGNDYLDGFHSARWVPYKFPGTNIDVPGAGNVIVYQNDDKEANEIELPGDGDGIYPRNPGEAFAPDDPLWTYNMSDPNRMEGSVQRLPNGNTFICDAGKRIYEVTQDKQTVWSMNISREASGANQFGALQAFKYALTYFDEATPVQGKNGVSSKPLDLHSYYNTMTGTIDISLNNTEKNAKVKLFSLSGKELYSKCVDRNIITWDVSNEPNGAYIVQVISGDKSIKELVHIIR